MHPVAESHVSMVHGFRSSQSIGVLKHSTSGSPLSSVQASPSSQLMNS